MLQRIRGFSSLTLSRDKSPPARCLSPAPPFVSIFVSDGADAASRRKRVYRSSVLRRFGKRVTGYARAYKPSTDLALAAFRQTKQRRSSSRLLMRNFSSSLTNAFTVSGKTESQHYSASESALSRYRAHLDGLHRRSNRISDLLLLKRLLCHRLALGENSWDTPEYVVIKCSFMMNGSV